MQQSLSLLVSREWGFIISPKSALLTNSARPKHIVSSALKGIKVELKCVNSAPDLGLDRTADGSRPTGNGTKRSARQKAAEEKAKRINRLRGEKERAQFTKSVVVAQDVYGTEALAVTLANALEIRRTVTNPLSHKHGMCNTSLLKIYDEDCPIADIRWRQVKEWIFVWLQCPHLHAQIRKVWKHLLGKMSIDDHRSNFKKACGPLGSMLATLLELGLLVPEPNQWDTGKGRIWVMSSDPIDLLAFKKQFYQFVESKNWEKACI